VYAVDWNTGKIAWKYEAPAVPFESPYISANGTGVYSWNSGGIVADGKIYLYNTEHTPSAPITRGWGLHCIDALTGKGIWNITTPGAVGAVADGYLSVGCTDGVQYIFGKGKSATTITAPDVAVPKGMALVIKGTVMDLSPGQPNTPCVSVDSMRTQMEYLHKQQPIDGIWHNLTIAGVPVKLTALSSDGSFTDIGTITTDGYYGTFSKSWTPPNEGDYTIIASFAGDGSYGSSAASTAVFVGPAPTTSNTGQQQITIPDYTTTIIAGVIAIIIAVTIVGVLVVRKK
jgi:hypothetical protein